MRWWLVLAGALLAGPMARAQEKEKPPAPADAGDQAEERRKLEEQIARDLGAQAAAPPREGASGATPQAGGSTAPGAPTGGNPLARLLLLPDLSVLGRGALVWNQRDTGTESPRGDLVAPPRKLDPVFQELELALQAVVDPYVRGDVFLTFGPQGAGVEEAVLTSLGLPVGLQVKAGALHAPFGRLNAQHPHAWDFADPPLAMVRLLAKEALAGPGVSVGWLTPLPWFAELTLGYQKTAPGLEEEARRTGLARLVQYVDLAEGLTLGVGLSAARLDEPAGAWRDLFGADLFLKYRPAAGRAYATLQGELFGQRLRGLADPTLNLTRRGGYLQALWRIDRFWAVGARVESAPAMDPQASGTGFVLGGAPERRLTGLVGWYLTEFQRLRLQLSRDQLPGRNGLEALLALDFAMGIHGAHPF